MYKFDMRGNWNYPNSSRYPITKSKAYFLCCYSKYLYVLYDVKWKIWRKPPS